MLLLDAGLAWLHFVFVFLLVGVIVAEAYLLRLRVDANVARLILRVDLFYGVSSVLIILAGVARVIWGVKGWEYYQHQPFFWAKMVTFAVIGLISIAPTRTFMRWGKAANANPDLVIAEDEVRRVRRLVMGEVHLLAVVALFAALMARGIGG